MLRATREDPAAASASASRCIASVSSPSSLSAALVGFAGGLDVHFIPVNTESVYLDLTFLTLAMLVVGGLTSLWGAVVGALAVSALDSWLAAAENGTTLFGAHVDLPAGTRLVVVGVLMAARAHPPPERPYRRPRVSGGMAATLNRICVAGAGTIGSLLAAHLARVADVSVLTRRDEHARALNEQGLRVSGRADFTASVSASADPADLDADLVIVACKGNDLERARCAARRALRRRDRDDGA